MQFKMINWIIGQMCYETAVVCFITRLPCIHYANFNIVSNWYFKGDVFKKWFSISKEECGTVCVTNSLCVVANYNADENLCEIISKTQLQEQRQGWYLLMTNTTSDINIGPLCEQSNLCMSNEWCRDVCGQNNLHTFNCLNIKNVAKRSKVFQSSTYSYTNRPEMAIDGDLQTASCTQMDPINWFKLDMLYVYKLVKIKIINRLVYPERLAGYKLMSSTNDENYEHIVTLSRDWQQTYNCSNSARFIMVSKVPDNNQYLNIAEIEVWV
ncbi:uncharacterized protein LOC100201052 [Hydra vulgaris]|uniref:uncharacterized protein LOC100201052 n=1 Tax=Hydra vulgaris TaxID=6087 RepID=UPI00064143CD|nr:uncharacterized protein LOC100201052 [Hydra vulgaris]